ncbi:hypothetical protein WA158_002541 [Blastocystis sp. Blastoise]
MSSEDKIDSEISSIENDSDVSVSENASDVSDIESNDIDEKEDQPKVDNLKDEKTNNKKANKNKKNKNIEKKKKDPKPIDVEVDLKNDEWYLNDFKNRQSFRHRMYRLTPLVINDPEKYLKQLYREMKKGRIFLLRNMKKKLSLMKEKKADEEQINSLENTVHNIENLDLFAVIHHLLPEIYNVPVPKNYEKPLEEPIQKALDMLIHKKEVVVCVEKIKSIISVKKEQHTDIKEQVVTQSIKETKQEVGIDLSKLSKKRRRAAEYKLRMQAENKGSIFLSKLNNKSSLGSSSARSRQEAARTTILEMNLGDTIKEKMTEIEEEEHDKKMGIKRKPTKPAAHKEKRTKKPAKETVVPASAPAPVTKSVQPLHPSWAARNAEKEKEKLHISLNGPVSNKKIVFDE